MVKKIIKIALIVILAVVFARAIMVLVGYESDPGITGERVAIIDFEGTIMRSDAFIKRLQSLEDTANIYGIIIRVNSPGGAVTPSNEIYDYILTMRKPVYVSMGSVAASGGYMVSLAANKIYAMPSTVTGSIGVIMNMINTEELFNKIGIKSVTLKSGKFKDAGNPDRPMTEEEREILMAVVMDMYNQFVDIVSARRNMDREEVLKVADGRILTGNMAKSLKLVDELGTWRDAFRDMKVMLNMPNLTEYIVPKKMKWWESMIEESAPLGFFSKDKFSSGIYYMTDMQ